MQVRMLVSMAGVDFAVRPGDLYECDPASAARLIAAGYAEPVELETAMRAPATETAMRPRRGKAR